MISKSLSWQKKHTARSKKTLGYDNRSAGMLACKIGRALTKKEYESFKIITKKDVTPIKKLTFDGKNYGLA